jgi:thiol-disulfide isomerase/thioredoxin
MIFKHSNISTKNIEEINKYIEQGKHVFVLIYMEGCGPCNATRPEWAKIKHILEKKYKNNNEVVIVDVDSRVSSELKHIGDIDGYPTMKYISKNGNMVEAYENSSISKKDRSVNSFVEWVESKINNEQVNSSTNNKMSSPYDLVKRLEPKYPRTRKYRQKGGKWSLKYKRSINCKRPKGFSQKNYCARQKRHGKYKASTLRSKR